MAGKPLNQRAGKRLAFKQNTFRKELRAINNFRIQSGLIPLNIINRECLRCGKIFETVDGYNKMFTCGCIEGTNYRSSFDE